MRFRRFYFILSGVAVHFIILLIWALVFKHYDLSSTQVLHRLLEKFDINTAFIKSTVLNNEFDYPLIYKKTPTLIAGPRFLLQSKQFISGDLLQIDIPPLELAKYNPCHGQSLLALMSCGIVTQNKKALAQAKNQTLAFNIILPNASGHYANGWELAFAYDALKYLIEYSPREIAIIKAKLDLALKHYLILLNDDDASLWHGRTTLSAQMWMTLSAMDTVDKYFLMNATTHFYSMVDALSVTEAWPEGYNYWINSRAFYAVLSLSAYLNGTESDIWHDKIIKLLERIGYWHIYATRPDWQIEPLGDEGPRIDLKDESRRVIDIIAQATRNPVFVNYSNKLAELHGVESYYSAYRWGWSLFYPFALTRMETAPLPLMEIFGRDYFGQSYIRENWQDNTTFLTFRAGNSFTHHGHYDNGHISLFKGAPLLVNSSVPGRYYSKNRLNYSIRTIAKNSILVQREYEKVDIGANWNNDVASGGQRVTLPIGSAITTVTDWFEKNTQSPILAGGRILLTDDTKTYSYIKADLTKAYNSTWFDDNGKKGKLERVEREILYLRLQDTLLIKDTVSTEDKNQVKVVFHTVNKPLLGDEKLLKGNLNNGIVSSKSKMIKIQNEMGFLSTEVLSDIAEIRLIGGPDYKFYVETDGNDNLLNGENFSEGLSPEQIKSAPSWRIEINAKREVRPSIVTVHRPSLYKYREEETSTVQLSFGFKAYLMADIAIIYSNTMINSQHFTREDIHLLKVKNVLVCGLEDKDYSACKIINFELRR